MNAAETIQAAIDKLTQLRDQSSSAGDRWSTSGIRIYFEDNGQKFPMFEMASWGTRVDRDLVLTLHATIDAQLSLFRFAERQAALGEVPLSPIVTLARAIVGKQATDD